MGEKHLRGFSYIIVLLFVALLIVGCTLVSMQVNNTQGDGNACRIDKSSELAPSVNSPDVCLPLNNDGSVKNGNN